MAPDAAALGNPRSESVLRAVAARDKGGHVKKTLAIAFAVAFAISSIAAPTMAGNKNAYGKQIKDRCGVSYGQYVKAAKKSGHVTGPVRGAKYFVVSGLLDAHCPVVPVDPVTN
jgi:hypothetical protein